MKGQRYRQYSIVTGSFLTLAFGSLLFFQRMDETRKADRGVSDDGMQRVTLLLALAGGLLALSSLLPVGNR